MARWNRPFSGIAETGPFGSANGHVGQGDEGEADLERARGSRAFGSRPSQVILCALSVSSRGTGTTPQTYAFVTTIPNGVAPAGSAAGEDVSSVRRPPSTLKPLTASMAASTT